MKCLRFFAGCLLAILLLAYPLASANAATSTSFMVIASGMTTNTTTPLALAIVPNGAKTIYGEVVCSSGACTQTQAIYGTLSSTAVNGILLCTLTLSATPRAQDACAATMAAFPNFYVITTNTTGTVATGAIYVLY